MSNVLIKNFIEQLIEIEKGIPWMDETIEKKLNHVKPEDVFRRPLPYVHSVAEILSHLIAWRFEIISRLKGNKRKMDVNSPENWRSNEELEIDGWQHLLNQFKESQSLLIALLEHKNDDFLLTPFEGNDYKYLIEGAIHHDLYHLGQIGLVNKMLISK